MRSAHTLFADYATDGIANETLSLAVAGFVGVDVDPVRRFRPCQRLAAPLGPGADAVTRRRTPVRIAIIAPWSSTLIRSSTGSRPRPSWPPSFVFVHRVSPSTPRRAVGRPCHPSRRAGRRVHRSLVCRCDVVGRLIVIAPFLTVRCRSSRSSPRRTGRRGRHRAVDRGSVGELEHRGQSHSSGPFASIVVGATTSVPDMPARLDAAPLSPPCIVAIISLHVPLPGRCSPSSSLRMRMAMVARVPRPPLALASPSARRRRSGCCSCAPTSAVSASTRRCSPVASPARCPNSTTAPPHAATGSLAAVPATIALATVTVAVASR